VQRSPEPLRLRRSNNTPDYWPQFGVRQLISARCRRGDKVLTRDRRHWRAAATIDRRSSPRQLSSFVRSILCAGCAIQVNSTIATDT
jgi:hypothetical protein